MEQSRYAARITELMSQQGADSSLIESAINAIRIRQGFMGVDDMALLMGTTAFTIRKWCREKRIPARKVAGVWHIALEGMFYDKQR